MENLNIQNLLDSVSILLDESSNMPHSSLKLLSLSKNCIFYKKKTLLALKTLITSKFEKKFKIFEEKLELYKEKQEILEGNLPIDEIKLSASLIHDTLNDIFRIENLLCKCLFPLNMNSYFLDLEMPYIEKVIKTSLFKKLKNQFNTIGNFICFAVLAYKELLVTQPSDATIEFASHIKFLLNVLKSFNLRDKTLKYSKNALISSYVNTLQPLVDDFIFISNYFQSQKSIYPRKFKNKIERAVLNKLYHSINIDFLSTQLPMNIESIYYIFCKGLLKDKLLEAFSKLLYGNIESQNFEKFVNTFDAVKIIIQKCPDKDFESIFKKYFETISESPKNCDEMAKYVDSAIKDNKNIDNLKIIAEIIDMSKNPELLLKKLQQQLTFRLLDLFKGRTGDLNLEMRFLHFFEKLFHSENMKSMIKDLESSEPGLLLMKMCKWPMLCTKDIDLPNDNSIIVRKNDIVQQLKNEKKRVSWVDALSFVNVLLFDKEVKLSLFQYSIINKIINEGSFYNSNTLTRSNASLIPLSSSSYSTLFYKNLNDFVPQCYIDQFSCLLNDLILFQENLYILNPFFEKRDFLNFKCKFMSTNASNDTDHSYSVEAYNQARVSKILKTIKKGTFDQILENIPDLSIDNLKITITELEAKGICEIHDDNVTFCP